MSLSASYESALKEIETLVVGQSDVLRMSLLTLIAGGHVLLEGVPGLAKTLMVKAIAKVLGLEFQRVQFTPDLLPSDITGTEIFEDSVKSFRFVRGPVFTQVLLADEINRTPPKTQSALLQSMQEREVTVLGKTYALPEPFFVMATQNPIEQEGTYPLPEAQLDRFMTHLILDYPSSDEEEQILEVRPEKVEQLNKVLGANDLLLYREEVEKIEAGETLKHYVVSLVRETRPKQSSEEEIQNFVEWGAGPRASQLLLRLARAHAAVLGKPVVDKEDVDHCFLPALRHRLVLNYRGLSERISKDEILLKLLTKVGKRI